MNDGTHTYLKPQAQHENMGYLGGKWKKNVACPKASMAEVT